MLRTGRIEAILSRWAEMCSGCYNTGIVGKKPMFSTPKNIGYNFTDSKCDFYPGLVLGYSNKSSYIIKFIICHFLNFLILLRFSNLPSQWLKLS